MADYSHINLDRFEPTEYPNWGYQNDGSTESIIYYPTGEIWELGQITGWHNRVDYDIVVLINADIEVASCVVDYVYGTDSSIEYIIDYFSGRLGYDLG